MKYKYLTIYGTEVEVEDTCTREELLKQFCAEDGIMRSVTPPVEINGEPFWMENTAWGRFTRKQWCKIIRPQLIKQYGKPWERGV
jgi:hypothetical protein